MATQAQMAGTFDIGRVLTRGFRTIGRQFMTFVALSVLLAGLPAALLGYLLPTTAAATPAEALNAIANPPFWATFLVMIVFSYVLQAALVRASILDLQSEPVDIGKVLGEALVLLLPMIGLSIVMILGVGLGLILLIVPGIILYVMWIVAVPVLVQERRGVFGSMARSAELTKGSRWWIFLLLLIYLVASSVIGGMINLTATAPGLESIGALILNVITSSLIGMVTAAMLASIYIELRLVKEGGTEDSLAEIFA